MLEASNFIKHRTHILMLELRDRELVVQETIPEHKVLPDVDFFFKKTGLFKFGFIFNKCRVKTTLRYLDVPLIFDKETEASESLRDALGALFLTI